WLGDRMSRWLLIGVGVILWSLASGASGLATGYAMLLITRCFVGVGEAAYGPVAPTVIADLYPVRVRGSKLAWFYAAIPVGTALGYAVGGLFADSSLGWRWAFYCAVPPGFLLGVWCFLMREPPRGQAEDAPAASEHTARLQDIWVLKAIPSYVLDTLGMAAMTFALGGMAAWMPTYIFEQQTRIELTDQVLRDLGDPAKPPAVPESVVRRLEDLRGRVYGLQEFKDQLKSRLSREELEKYEEHIQDLAANPSLGKISMIFGAIVVVSGLGATLLGGVMGDALRSRFAGSYFLVSGVSMLLGFPLVLLVLWATSPLAVWIFIFLAVFCLFFNTGPTNTILANVTPAAIRSSAFAVNIFLIHLLGDAISPVIIGGIADFSNKKVAFAVVSAIILVGGVLWLWGARYLQRDTQLAPTRLGPAATEG
ncbi:MAG: MFS transporter, partial [Planctomycetes bacterium]|nr:MFS transporter [Planctomycetota bacterium]